MTDLSMTIAPKSDQLNSDDLISGPRTIRITKVSANPDSAEQPISIAFEGDNGKPYKPCKSMRRVLVHVWGKDGNAYAGRSMTIYRDAKVQFGGLEVGGIRISHMSHIDADVTLALTATRANRKPFRVKPLAIDRAAVEAETEARAAAAKGTDAFRAWWTKRSPDERASIMAIMPDLKATADAADEAARDASPFGLPDLAEEEARE
jgi:hypothetical protein